MAFSALPFVLNRRNQEVGEAKPPDKNPKCLASFSNAIFANKLGYSNSVVTKACSPTETLPPIVHRNASTETSWF